MYCKYCIYCMHFYVPCIVCIALSRTHYIIAIRGAMKLWNHIYNRMINLVLDMLYAVFNSAYFLLVFRIHRVLYYVMMLRSNSMWREVFDRSIFNLAKNILFLQIRRNNNRNYKCLSTIFISGHNRCLQTWSKIDIHMFVIHKVIIVSIFAAEIS